MTPAERAQRRVLRWVDRYSKGLPLPVAEERRAELESDLHEHITARHDEVTPRELAREIDRRALHGVAADLLWRDREMRRFRAARLTTMTPSELRATSRLQHLLYVAAGVLAVVALTFAVRAAITTHFGTPGRIAAWYGDSTTALPLFVTASLAIASLALLLSTATRAAGVVTLAVSALLLNWFTLATTMAISWTMSRMLLMAVGSLPGQPYARYAIFLPGPLLVVAFALILGRIHRIERNPDKPNEAGAAQ